VHPSSRSVRRAILALLLVSAPWSSALGQDIQGGVPIRRELRGIVTDSTSRQPVAGVNVLIDDTRLGTTTDSAGRYRIAGSLPAAVTIIFRHIGYSAQRKRADLSRGSATVDVILAVRPVSLEAVNVRADSAAKFLRSDRATSVMDQEDVQQHRGQTLGETIKALPGVSVIQYGPSIAKPVVRGLHSQRIATVNAGVPQEGQQWGGEHAPEIDAFAANLIEVIRGRPRRAMAWERPLTRT
jgi:iron complex outermembrane recepter protein